MLVEGMAGYEAGWPDRSSTGSDRIRPPPVMQLEGHRNSDSAREQVFFEFVRPASPPRPRDPGCSLGLTPVS
jgi:hypothetical protein